MTENYLKHLCIISMTKVGLLVFMCVVELLNTNQSKECECIMEFPLINFNVLIKGLSGFAPTQSWLFSVMVMTA